MLEDKFLLECNFDEVATTSGKHQEYWLLAIQAAWEVCQLRRLADGTERMYLWNRVEKGHNLNNNA
jgi:hypothetical protein